MLLLDDEDVVEIVESGPPTKVSRTEHTPDACSTRARDDGVATSPSTVPHRPPSPPRAAAVPFRVKGGDGLAKMAALAYGAPRAQIVKDSPSPATHARRAAAEAVRSTPRERTQPTTLSAATASSTPASADRPAASDDAGGVVDLDACSPPACSQPVVSRSLRPALDGEVVTASVSPSPAPRQMNLADFFSKMKCKATS